MSNANADVLPPQTLTPESRDRGRIYQPRDTASASSAPGAADPGQDNQPDKPKSPVVRLRPLRTLAPYVLRYPSKLALTALALVASAGAMLAVPVAVRRMIDFGFTGSNGATIDLYFAMMIGLGGLLAVASASRFYLVNWLGERVVSDVRADVFANLVTLGPAFFEKAHSGEVMSRLTADTTQIKSASGSTLSQALRNTIMLIGAVSLMFVTSVKLSLLVLVAIPALVLPLMAAGNTVRSRSRHAQDTLAEASAYAQENLAAVRTMQAFTHEAAVVARFRASVERSFEAARSRLSFRAFLTASAMFLGVASVVGVLWLGARWVVAGDISGGLLSQFVLYAMFAAGALAELAEVWTELQTAAGAAERLGELLVARPEIVAPANPQRLPVPSPGTLAFEDVHFAYPSRPDLPALKGVTLSVRRGETVAIVGPSGAGKSTLFSLLMRFYDPQRGVVRLDGVAVNACDPSDLRRRMAIVPQDVAVFAETIAENIAYGRDGAPHDAIVAAAKAAYADGFIRALPEGYDTRLGERGVTLSGGQRQRLAIARAILRDAPILLLDEATSALDAESEAVVQEALERVMAERTTLVIAHRLATVQRADRILVMDDGRIVETGTRAELIAKGGLYARLDALQFAGT